MALAKLTDKAKRQLGVACADKHVASDIVDRINEVCTRTTDPLSTVGLGAAAGTGVTAVESVPTVHKTVLTLAATSITVTDTGGAAGGQGSQKVYDFPEGCIKILGATCNLSTVASGGIGATAALVGSLGTVAAGAGDATLTTTEANLIPSMTGTLTGSAGTLKGQLAADAIFDGTTTPIDAILNIAVPDAGISANGAVAVSGTITITWMNLGDY